MLDLREVPDAELDSKELVNYVLRDVNFMSDGTSVSELRNHDSDSDDTPQFSHVNECAAVNLAV